MYVGGIASHIVIGAVVGMSNALPLALELILGSFRPKLFGERRRA